MSTFVWEGTNNSGKKVKGEMEAPNQQAVYNALRSQKINPYTKKIREKGS